MSDEEEVGSDEEIEETKAEAAEEEEDESEDEEQVKKPEGRSTDDRDESKGEEAEFIKRQQEKRSDLDEQLKEYIQEWRKQRAREEEELVRLKDKQSKRKTLREQEEKRLGEKKRQEEERRVREVEEKKQREQEEKLRRLEEAEKKRQLMLQAQKASLTEKGFMGNRAYGGGMIEVAEIGGGRPDLMKTKEQLEEEKKISMSFRIKPLDFTGLSEDVLKKKAGELWEQILRLETEKYDLEERQKRQDYDLKELRERQKQQLRHKALKRGLDPEALTGKYPPKLQVASKYERRVDTRSYDEKKNLFQGDLENLSKETQDKTWAENIKVFEQRQKTKLPKWFGERPGKKKDAPESPEEEEVKDIPISDDVMLEEPNFEKDEEAEPEAEEEEDDDDTQIDVKPDEAETEESEEEEEEE